jgi:hypothetical protein
LLAAWWLSERLATRPASGPRWQKGFAIAAVVMLGVLGVAYPWSNGRGGVTRFAEDVRTEAVRTAPWDQWQMVLVEVDNKVPLYLQNPGRPFYYVSQAQDFPRLGDSAAFMAWLDTTSGRHFDPQRTIIVTAFSKDDLTPLAYLAVDHQVVTTQPDNGERLFHVRQDGSRAFIPRLP